MLSCTVALHIDYFHLLALSRLHLDSCLSHLLTMSYAKSTLQSLNLCNLTHPYTCGKNIPLSTGMFPFEELEHLLFQHSFFPLYYRILLFFFKLHIKEKDKYIYIYSKKSGNGTLFLYLDGS